MDDLDFEFCIYAQFESYEWNENAFNFLLIVYFVFVIWKLSQMREVVFLFYFNLNFGEFMVYVVYFMCPAMFRG